MTGARRLKFESVRGTKKEAQAVLNRRLAEIEDGQFVERSDVTVGDYCRHWLAAIAPAKTSAKTPS